MRHSLLCSIALFVSLVQTNAQELNCDVTVNFEGIPSSQRDFLKNFEADLERYLNNTKFSSEDLDGERIQCTMDVFFKAVVGENRYQAQVFIGSQRPVYVKDDKTEKVSPILRILDERWEFTYMPNQRMIQDDFNFDPLTDFLDFYAFLIIAFDLETYTPLSGSRYFQKALSICNQGSTSAFATDWQRSSATYSRVGMAEELNEVKYDPARVAFNNYHFDGIDLLGTEPQKGLDNILKAVESINKIRRQNPLSVLVKQFFDAKNKEIADVFQTYPDRSIYDRLSELDPEHRAIYQDRKAKF